MKKIAILLTIALVLGISLAAYAGATRYVFDHFYTTITGNESGFAVVNNQTNGPNPKTIIEIQVRGMDPSTPYWGYYHLGGVGDTWISLGELKINKSGSGHVHAKVTPALSGSFWVGVSQADPATMVLADQVMSVQLP